MNQKVAVLEQAFFFLISVEVQVSFHYVKIIFEINGVNKKTTFMNTKKYLCVCPFPVNIFAAL